MGAARRGFNDIMTEFVLEYEINPNVEDIDVAFSIVFALLQPFNEASAIVAHLCDLGA